MGNIDLNLEASVEVAYDTNQAAQYLGCSASYLKKLRQTGGGPGYNRLFTRKGVRYRRHTLDQWVAERSFGSTTDYPESLP